MVRANLRSAAGKEGARVASADGLCMHSQAMPLQVPARWEGA